MSKKLTSIQILRALAALCVVAHHVFRATTILSAPPAGSIVPNIWAIQLGAAGVDVFFVISGFLMVYIAEPYFSGKKSPGDFLAQRVIRIWPPYLIATLFAILVIYRYSKGVVAPFDLQPQRLASIFFIPSFNQKHVLQPIIGPGWTLNYEMMFYFCFFVVLSFGKRFFSVKLFVLLAILYGIGRIAPWPVAHEFLGNSIIFEFLIGVAIGSVLRDGRFVPSHGWAWIAASIILAGVMLSLGMGENQRLVCYGIPAALLFIGFCALEPVVRWPAWMVLIGDASYSIYLTHTLVIYKVIRVDLFQRYHVESLSVLAASFCAIALATCIGIGFFYVVERPLLRAGHRWLKAATLHRAQTDPVVQ